MDKGACNHTLPMLQVKFKYMASSVYNWLHHSGVQQEYTEWVATPLPCVKVAKLLQQEDHPSQR